jgi:hypothetical protein
MEGFKKWWNGQGWAFISDNELREHGRACATLAWNAQDLKIKELEDEIFDLKKQVITELSEKLKLAERALSNHSCVHAPLNDYNCFMCETLEVLQGNSSLK